MKPVVAFAAGFLVLIAAVAFTFFRGESTRDRVRIVERGPAAECVDGRVRACRELARALRDARRSGSDSASGSRRGGGGAGTSPTGGGPVGRVPPREGSPPEERPPNAPETPEPEPDRPLIDLSAPAPVRTCVGDLLGINCD